MAAMFLPLFWTLFRGYEKACLICWQAYFLRGAPRLTEACPRPSLGRKKVLARGQSEAHGDSNLYNTIVGVPWNWFFFLEYGRCRTVARSLHEHKQ